MIQVQPEWLDLNQAVMVNGDKSRAQIREDEEWQVVPNQMT